MGLPPGDYRNESYKRIGGGSSSKKKETNTSSAGGQFETGTAGKVGYASTGVSQIKEGTAEGQGTVLYSGGGTTGGTTSLAPGTTIKSQVAGSSQVAVRGSVGSNTRVVSESVGGRTIAAQVRANEDVAMSQRAPVDAGLKKDIQVELSPGLYGKYTNTPVFFVNPKNRYYVNYENPLNDPVAFQKELLKGRVSQKIKDIKVEAQEREQNRLFFGWNVLAEENFARAKLEQGSLISSLTKTLPGTTTQGAVSYLKGLGYTAGSKTIEPALYSLFTPQKDLVLGVSDRDLARGIQRQSQVREQITKGIFDLGIFGSGLTLAKPVIKTEVNVNLRNAYQETIKPGEVTGRSRLSGEAEIISRDVLSAPTYRSYRVQGTGQELRIETNLLGRKSQSPIYTSEGQIEYQLIPNLRKGKTFTGSVKFEGSEVDAFGQVKVQSKLVDSKGKLLDQDAFVETYGSFEKPGSDIIYGGSVSRKGSSVYVGEKVFESDLTIPARPKVEITYAPDETLGLDILGVTPKQAQNLGLKPVSFEIVNRDVPGVLRGYDIRSASQVQTPISGRLFRAQIVERLKTERAAGNPDNLIDLRDFKINPGKVGEVAREQITSTVVKTSPVQGLTQNLIQQNLQRTAVLKTNLLSTPSANIGGGVVLSPQISRARSSASQSTKGVINVKTRQKPRAIAIPKVAPSENMRTSALPNLQQVLARLSNNNLNNRVKPVIRPISASIPSQKTGAIPAIKPATITESAVSNTFPPRPPRPVVVVPPTIPRTPFVPILPRPELQFGSRNRRFKGNQPTAYIPSFSALFFKIRGTYKPSTASKSGLDFRPITRNFNFNNLLKQTGG